VQARAAGAVSGGLSELRRRVASAGGLQEFRPQLSRL
jgi:rhamnulokinase